MKSHTVPKKLLEQFAYDDPVTRSKRLWRYEKDRPPYGKASPKTATRFGEHFADPLNSDKEQEIESRLKREFEDPVNGFIDMVGYRTFVLSPTHIRQLTGYITVLFNRSRARQRAARELRNTRIESMRSLLSNEEHLSALAAKYTIGAAARGLPLSRMITKEDIANIVTETIAAQLTDEQVQHDYAGTVETMMEFADRNMMTGQWDLVRTEPENPFVIGDAPVVTWERTDANALVFGQGFSRPNVEVVLPLSPTVCLHARPLVMRTRPVRSPAAQEVNIAQAVFATQHCFSNVRSETIDAALQPNFGRARLGVNAFSLAHRDFSNFFFETLMKNGEPG
jgi:hypothetical protein